MRILIADDEAPARTKLRRLLQGESDVTVVGEAASGAEAVTAIAELRPDLVLLDIQMPGLDGFGVIEAVGLEAMPAVVFVTAYDEHALRAFDAQAIDYLLKPVRADRLASVLERVRGLAARREPKILRHILVHHESRASLVPVSRIIRVSAEGNYLRLHLAGAEHTVRGTITSLESRLDPAAFLRISRGDIVRLEAIKEMQPWSHGDYHVILHDGSRLTWSRRYRAKVAPDFFFGLG
ncbi:MAG: LytR/AlgR family response regulator transcription factor [Gemmatimonadaceae bacterium]